MTTKMSSQPPVMFKTNFGFRGGGLRHPLFSGSNPVQGVQYNSLPCHVQADQRDNDSNYDSLKYEGENPTHSKGLRKPSRMTFPTRNVVTVNGRDTNNNPGSVSPVDVIGSSSSKHPRPTSSLTSSSSSSQSSSSPSTSSRSSLDISSRIPISKSQDDLLRNVKLRNRTGAVTATDKRSPARRPVSYRNSSPSTSKLMSRNSVEVLAFSESNKNISNIQERKHHNCSASAKGSNKYETAAKFTKKFGSKDSSLNNLYQKNSKKAVITNSRSNSSLIPQPSSSSVKSNQANKSTPVTGKKPALKAPAVNTKPQTKVQSKTVGQNKLLNVESKKPVVSRNNSPKTSSNLGSANKEEKSSTSTPTPAKTVSSDSLKIDDHLVGEEREERPAESMISLGGVSDYTGTLRNVAGNVAEEQVEKMLSEQLARGKLPPKAKFRADDEISIGEADNVDGEVGDKRHSVSSGVSDINQTKMTPETPVSRISRSSRIKDIKSPDPYPPSQASLLVAKFLEEGGGRGRNAEKTNSLPLNSALVSFDEKSTSLGHHYKADKHQQQSSSKSTSEGFFQRLSNLRRSFNAHDQKQRYSAGKIRPHLTDSNSPFFQGIADNNNVKRPSTSSRPKASQHRLHHSSNLVLPPLIKSYKPPPRKYQFQRSHPVKTGNNNSSIKRSFSFSDGQLIAQCVVQNDINVIAELFPAFLNSEDTLYTVIDKDKLNKTDDKSVKLNPIKVDSRGATHNASEQTLIGDNAVAIETGSAVIDDDRENDKNDESVSSGLLEEAGSQLTLTSSSIVNINNMTGVSKRMDRSVGSEDNNVTLNSSVVTNISVEQSQEPPATPGRPVIIQQESVSPIISPWTSRPVTSGVTTVPTIGSPVSVSGDNVVRLDVVTQGSGSTLNQPHPFIYRVQNQLNPSPVTNNTNGVASSRLSPSVTKSPLTPDPFKKILAAADDNICQAESILSSLGYDGIVTSSQNRASDSEDDLSVASGLGSDIETNIRKLEKTQAKINAALQTFRSVQSQQKGANSFFNSSAESSFNDKNLSYCSLPAHEILAEPKFKKPEPLSVTTGAVKEKKERKTSIIRRHSFNNLASKERSPPSTREAAKRDSMYLYDGDIDSSEGGNRTSSVYEDCSDNEANFSVSPLKSRIRGLFGSFGKGKKSRTHSEDLSSSDKRHITIEYPDTEADCQDKEGTFSIGHFTELVKSLPAHHFSGRDSPTSDEKVSDAAKKPTFLRPRDPERVNGRQSKSSLCHNNSSDTTYSSSLTSQSINMSSNRNSVISTQSSESPGSVSDNGDMTQSSTSPKESRPENHEYISSSKAQEKKVFYIAKEIMTSEKTYVDVLKLVNIDFRDFVQKARLESKSGILPDHDFVKLFSNLSELMMLNEDLLRDFQDRINNWDDHKKIADVIIKKGPYLKLYTVYIRDFSAMNFHFDDVCHRYPKFGKLVKEFEKQPRCQSLKLKHFMLKPVQRLPQYKLLLEDYLKHLSTDSIDWDDTTLALKIVSDAAEHANNTVKQGDKFQAMLRLQSRMSDWEFIRPGRDLVKEGELQKISRKGVTSRYFALLSDCLLYCSYQGSWAGDNTSLKVGHTIPLNQLQVHVPTAEDFQNEFSITSNVRSCTLRARNVQERNDWLDALNSAIEDYRSRKATFVSLDMTNSPLRSNYKLGDAAPVWVPDTRVTMCQSCSTEFSLVHRRHHCRACGKVVCATCSSNKAPLRYRQFESSRVCDSCFDGVEKIYGDDIDLRSRFKRRDISRTVARFVPQRLKLSANSEGSQVSGYLRRKQKNSKWKRCWFVLKDRVLYTYRASEDSVAIDTLPVLGWTVSILEQKEAESYESLSSYQVFTLSHPGSQTLMFCAENENSAEKWIASLREAVSF